MASGQCLCGAVRISVEGALPPPFACHCGQCRRQSGHVWAASEVLRENLTVDGWDRVTWYQSSAKARRGFCGTCGSFLFWDGEGSGTMDVAMGAFDAPTGARLAGHIWVGSKGDYYDVAGDAPAHARSPGAG